MPNTTTTALLTYLYLFEQISRTVNTIIYIRMVAISSSARQVVFLRLKFIQKHSELFQNIMAM